MLAEANDLVLVVDDDAGIRAAMERLLVRAGLRVATASGLREAIAITRQRRVVAAVVDLGLGRESGATLIRHLRRRRPAIAIVIFSGDAKETSGLDLGALHVRDFVPKPAAPRRILDAVLRACGHHAPLVHHDALS